MSDQGNVNSQIVDSVADVVGITSGLAPAQAFGMLDTVMTETLGMAMYNAISRQQGGSMIGSAAATAVCAKMLTAPFPFEIPAPPPSPPPCPDPAGGVTPLPPVRPPGPPPPPAWVIHDATRAAEAAIDTLRDVAEEGSEDAWQARVKLAQIGLDADRPIRPSPPPPPPPPRPRSPPASRKPHA